MRKMRNRAWCLIKEGWHDIWLEVKTVLLLSIPAMLFVAVPYGLLVYYFGRERGGMMFHIGIVGILGALMLIGAVQKVGEWVRSLKARCQDGDCD